MSLEKKNEHQEVPEAVPEDEKQVPEPTSPSVAVSTEHDCVLQKFRLYATQSVIISQSLLFFFINYFYLHYSYYQFVSVCFLAHFIEITLLTFVNCG